MYAVGVYGANQGTTPTAEGGGVYLFQPCANGGWGSAGAGCKSLWEPMGQQWGRWFVPLPYGIVAINQPVSQCQYQGRLYLTGGYSYNLVLDEQHRLWKQGIAAPAEVPDIVGSGAPDLNFAYFSWYDEYTGERSSLSKGVEIGTAVPRTWQNLPVRPPDDVYAGDDVVALDDDPVQLGWTVATGSDGNRLYLMRAGDKITNNVADPYYSICSHMGPRLFEGYGGGVAGVGNSAVLVPVTRATHLELWLSLDGDLPRLAARVAIGSTTYTESLTATDLGEAFISSFQRFPRCRFNVIYHDRQVMAGDMEHPDTVYLSSLFYPERYEGLAFRVRDGAVITGLCAMRDYCLVFTRNSMYIIQGYTDEDYQITLVDQSLGSVGHNCNVIMHGNPYILTEKGPYMYNGAWHPISPENQWVPVSDQFLQGDDRIEIAQTMIATDDPANNCYIISNASVAASQLHTPWIEPSVTNQRYFAVIDYTLVQPEAGGAMMPARVSFDSAVGGDSAYLYGASAVKFQFVKYLRNKWGMGNLYHFGAYWQTWQDDAGRYAPFCVIGRSGPFITDNSTYGGNPALAEFAWDSGGDGGVYPYLIRQPSKIVTGFYYFDAPDCYSMESKSFKRLWFHMRNFRDTNNYVNVYVTPDSGYWNKRFVYDPDGVSGQGIGEEPITKGTTPGVDQYGMVYPSFTWSMANINQGADEDFLPGDIILPHLPDHLAGRGLWLEISGYDLQFHGFGAQFTLGADSTLWVPISAPQ